MRLSEKTIELNVCAQINGNISKQIIWFGLTQAQEAIAGFDAATKLGGKVILFQFKASNHILTKTKARRFLLDHDQLLTLQKRIKTKRCAYYVFPTIGDTIELHNLKGDFYNSTWLLDVATLPSPFPPPTTKSGAIRKKGMHYADIIPPKVTIHSEPVESKLITLSQAIGEAEGIDMDVLNELKSESNFLSYDLRMAVIL